MDMVDELQKSTILSDMAARRLFIQTIRTRLKKDLIVDESAAQRIHLVALVTKYAEFPGGIQALVKAFADLDPDSEQRTELDNLLAEWLVCETFRVQDIDWLELRAVLKTLKVAGLGPIYDRSVRPRHLPRPTGCTTALHLFVHLADLNAHGADPPPWVTFLHALTERVTDDADRAAIRRAIEAWPTRSGAAGQLAGDSALSTQDAVDPPPRLVVQLAPDGLVDGVYALTSWVQWYAGGCWHSQPGDRELVSLATMERAVAKRARNMEETWREWSSGRGRPTIEFVLPYELLNHEINRWNTEWDSPTPKALAMDYPIVVRSLERLRTPRWHRVWHTRWGKLVGDAGGCLTYLPPREGSRDLTQLEAKFMDDMRWVSLVLSEPPLPDGGPGGQELEIALRTGLPVVIWHRMDCGLPRFLDVVDELLSGGGLADLPGRAGHARREALQRIDDEHIARHLTVLWDDPERQPGMFGSVNGSGGETRQ
jgi:hypothetical protein